MELQTLIHEYSDYKDLIKNEGLKIKNLQGDSLYLVKCPYGQTVTYDKDTKWKGYCKSAIIEQSTGTLISLSPLKSIKINKINGYDLVNVKSVQQLIDGTMINLFYYQGKWQISSRSEIGGKNSNYKCPRFQILFDECGSKIDYDLLRKDHSYSFVVRHIDNRIVTPVYNNILVLIRVFEKGDKSIRELPNSEMVSMYKEFDGFEVIEDIDVSELTKLSDIPWYCKGYSYEFENKRYAWINPNYKHVLQLTMNQINSTYHYIELRKKGTINEYLFYFPTKCSTFTKIRDKLHTLSNELYENYKSLHIKKEKTIKECPVKLRTLLFKLHGRFLQTKQPLTWNDIKDFIHKTDTELLVYALNHKS